MKSSKSDAEDLKPLKTKKSQSITKDFVALAGTSQQEAKRLLRVLDFKFEFLGLTNSVQINANRRTFLKTRKADLKIG